MHKTEPVQYEDPVTLICDDGSKFYFSSKAEVLQHLGLQWIGTYVGQHFKQYAGYNHCDGTPFYQIHHWIMRDGASKPLTAADFYTSPRCKRYWEIPYLFWNGNGPVPGTGKRRYYHSNYYRSFHSIAAKRDAVSVFEDEPKFRAKRNVKNIPEAWDDYPRSSCYDRSWKKFRKQQHKK